MATFGLFGQSSNTQPNNPTGAFGGNSAAPPFGSFGQQQQPPASNLFGQQQQQQQQQPAGGGGGLFGATNTQQNQPAQGGLFGQQQQQPQAGGGLFGNAQQPAAGSTLFGNNNQQPQQQGTGLFGQQQQQQNQPAQGGLFGLQQQQQQQPSTNLFGGGLGGQQQQPSTQSTGLFGLSQQPQLQQQQNQNQNPFNASTSNNTTHQLQGGSVLGASTVGQAGASSIQDRVQAVYEAWNPNSPKCRFTHYFYNMVDPQQVAYYGRPMNARNDAEWEKAVRTNPDPSCLVPVPAIGYEDLQKRVNMQAKFAEFQKAQLKEANDRLEALQQKHQLSTSLRAQRAALKQTEIDQGLAALVKTLHLMIPSVRATSIRPEEERLRGALEAVEDELKRPGGLGRMKGKLSELWTAVNALKAMRERARASSGGTSEGGGGGQQVEWQVIDEGGLNELAGVLANEQQGLAYVLSVLQKDKADLTVMETGFSGGTSLQMTGNAVSRGVAGGMRQTMSPHQAGDLTASLLGVRS
ncbi:hypothetical protein FRB96_004273 [Tulasnella sp. 330]|nr:hypothetical protein FRB96_004273 [Tulasnella sp. 330]